MAQFGCQPSASLLLTRIAVGIADTTGCVAGAPCRRPAAGPYPLARRSGVDWLFARSQPAAASRARGPRLTPRVPLHRLRLTPHPDSRPRCARRIWRCRHNGNSAHAQNVKNINIYDRKTRIRRRGHGDRSHPRSPALARGSWVLPAATSEKRPRRAERSKRNKRGRPGAHHPPHAKSR